ncbi:MAG: mitochondrial fission ELM1 family protein [Pseudomonadota bacterium]
MANQAPDCWILSDGKAGHENQSLGLAEALGCQVRILRLEVKAPWRWLPPRLWPDALGAVHFLEARPTPPWPALIIACGRTTAPVGAALRKASAGASFVVQIQDAKLPPARFDLVVVPEHDRLRGPNVLTSRGALTRVTPERLAAAAAQFAPSYETLPRPRVAALIGGTSRTHRMTEENARALGGRLAGLTNEEGAGLMVTLSRRTPSAAAGALRVALQGSGAMIWDGSGENPYFGLLALADHIVVTGDSVSMACEAAGTGKPLYVAGIDGGSPKFTRFHDSLRQAGIARPFAGQLEIWTYAPLAESARLAGEIRHRLVNRSKDTTNH